MDSPLDNTERARQAVLIFKLLAFFLAAGALHDFLYISYLEGSELENSDSLSLIVPGLQTVMGVTQAVINVLAIVYFLRWFRRAYANVARAGLRIKHTDSWAIGAWFVPFLNWVRPYSMMREIWWKTQRIAGRAAQSYDVLGWWWAAFIVHGLADRHSTRLMIRAETTAEIIDATWVDLFTSLFDVVAAVLTLLVIQKVADVESEALLYREVDKLGQLAPEPQELLPTEPDAYF
jgi:hypothetical protein